jgi:hypothetical protein
MDTADGIERLRVFLNERVLCPNCLSEETVKSFSQDYIGVRVLCTVCGWFSPQASWDPATATAGERVVRPNAERNAWLYDQYKNHPKKTLASIRREAKAKGWVLNDDNALLSAVKSHCRSLNIDMPKRKSTRIKQD